MMTIEKTVLLLATAACCHVGTAHAYCFEEASKRYSISEQLLRAIARVESNTNAAAMNMSHVGRTKSYDIGLMQINSSWLPKLRTLGIDEQALKDPCQNLMVGAWILAHHMREDGADWNGVGAYNASCRGATREQCAALRNAYTSKVYAALTAQDPQINQNIPNTQHRGTSWASRPQQPKRSVAPTTQNGEPQRTQFARAIRTVDDEI
jgi:soluble lytic murein transglycosylase-like protein